MPLAQLLPGLETGNPVTVGQSPAYDFSVSDEREAVFFSSPFPTVLSAIHMQVTDRPSPDAPSLTQAKIVQMVYCPLSCPHWNSVRWWCKGRAKRGHVSCLWFDVRSNVHSSKTTSIQLGKLVWHQAVLEYQHGDILTVIICSALLGSAELDNNLKLVSTEGDRGKYSISKARKKAFWQKADLKLSYTKLHSLWLHQLSKENLHEGETELSCAILRARKIFSVILAKVEVNGKF